MIRIAVPALVVMIAVVSFVGAAAWNRSGEPRLLITLTERELPMVVRPDTPGEDPGVLLSIAFHRRDDPLDALNWLTEPRLRQIGFTFNVPVGAPQAEDAYRSVPARRAWVALEYDGPTWQDIERRSSLSAPSRPLAVHTPRLVPVEAAADFETLRARYPADHLIVPGVIAVRYLPPARGGPVLHGQLREIVPPTIAVPAALRSIFDGLPPYVESAELGPRYEAEVAVGRLGLPYLRAARRLNERH